MDPATPDPQPWLGHEEKKDAEHLRMLSIFHYVMAGLSLLGVCFGGVYAAMGGAMLREARSSANAPPDAFSWMFLAIGGGIMVFALAMAVLEFLTARYLVARRHRVFCLVVSGIECLNAPLGTALGVFTIVVLMRESVRASFERSAR